MSKSFESLFETTDPITGEQLEWEWDSEMGTFSAIDRSLRKYTLTPLTAELEMDDSEVDDVAEEENED